MIAVRTKSIHTAKEERRKSRTKTVRKNGFCNHLLTYKIENKFKNSWMKPKILKRVGEVN